MKTNAPEKIYLEWYRVGDKRYREWVITPQTNNEPVEYTRTDVVIGKVCDYLKSLTYQEYSGGPLERMINDECIENLKKEFE